MPQTSGLQGIQRPLARRAGPPGSAVPTHVAKAWCWATEPAYWNFCAR